MTAQAEFADLVVRGGTIVDGSGGEPFIGDVAVRGGVIAFVGAHFGGAAHEEVDATGCIVTPGFVDIHTHYDGQAVWSDTLSPSSSHGVTTAVLGNCGVGFAPCRKADHQALIRLMEGVEDIPGVVMAQGLPWDWETFPQYLDALAARPRDIDVACLLPHSPLRVWVMGDRALAREVATQDDLAQMRDIAREALAAGAIGFATSRLNMHRTKAGELIPTYGAETHELIAICEALAEAGTGVFQAVLDAPFETWEDELTRLIAVAESAGRPATFTLALANSGPNTWDAPLRMVDEANARGLDISPQILPRPVGMVSGWALSTHPFCLCPSYRPLVDLPLEEQVVQLRDPAMRARLLAEMPQPGHPLAMLTRNWDWMFPFGDPPQYEPDADQSIGALARAQGRSPEEVAYDVLMENGGTGMILNTLGNFHEARLDALIPLVRRADTVIGLGDGGAHYAAICDASYPTFMLTWWVRDRAGERLSVAEVVHMLAAKPARVAGLMDRGLLRTGYKADVNVIDLAALRLHAPVIRHDLPGGGRRLDQTASGYVATVVSGQVIRRGDQPTDQRPGRVVRGMQQAPVLAVPV
ncbi:MAG: amidohydrolase [Novosphingobium sp. 28-62-57]|uniref:N-acyl-D-amino-acid deacylase family protein n=2 Tax=unclassified Novosphingobium TaxID=2644732 RepID=UPI000BD892EA|nr:D-aminoacylase [Novosphingobium sp.]OYW51519.1 MAG: amidohydrolase [Novosphingobium sp. 12-62-10]OYZ10593.1 MAG: amidohydrolase [Novosphingobium sp. 28-62-57]OZA40763.1 MAG: amidohydrolase [Novosphingobium sp. 17-62-9]HQS68202.1 D-aminoacylase [Novosphingobium sp.]